MEKIINKIYKVLFILVFMFFLQFFVKVYAAEIKDGVYWIKSGIDINYVLDITNDSKINGANLEIWKNNGGLNQKFEIKKVDQEYFTIKNISSGKYLDVAYASKKAGANVEQYTFNNQDNQKWKFIENENGYYNIQSKCNGLFLDIEGGKVSSGTNVVVWNSNNGKNQEFLFESIDKSVNRISVEEGIYNIAFSENTKYILDIEGKSKKNCANVGLWQNNDGNNQKFIIKSVGDNYYTIKCALSEKYLDVENALKNNGVNLEQYDYNNGNNQKWYFIKTAENTYSIFSKCNNLCIDIEKGIIDNGTNVILWQSTLAKNQQFKLIKTDLSKEVDEEHTGRGEQFKKEHPEIKVGIDVSKYQEEIDWEAVKKDGIDYVMVRVGFRGYGSTGSLNKDIMYEKNIEGAKKAGLDVGVYFFSQAINEQEGIAEAQYTLGLIEKYNITYPIAFDTEYSSSPNLTGRADNISVQDRTNAAKGFCRTIVDSGYKVLIYGNPYWFKEKIDLNQLKEYKIWLANYTGATQDNPLAKPSSYKGQYVMWQYTESGSVNGIKGGVDCNIFYYTEY